MEPCTIRAVGLSNFIRVRDMTDLPDPDSPTTASISPRSISIEKFSSAGDSEPDPGKSTVKFFICMSGSKKIFKNANVLQ